MANEPLPSVEKHIRIALIILSATLVALLIFLFAQYAALQQSQVVSLRQMRFSEMLSRHAPLPRSYADFIRTWMTFDYTNRLFALPPSYLQNQLHISDAKYPRLTIAEYVESNKLDETTILQEIVAAVRSYVPAPGSASTTVKSGAGIILNGI